MWIWWVLSLIILIACGIFTYRMIVSSYEFLPAERRFLFRFRKSHEGKEIFSDSPDPIRMLRSKIQHVEDNSTYYHIQFNKFQDRLQQIEARIDGSAAILNPRSPRFSSIEEDEEDWKELYFQENEKKEALENELDRTTQRLEGLQEKLGAYESEHQDLISVRSDYDLRRNDLESLQDTILTLQGKLDAAKEREKELEQVLLTEITVREKYNLLKKSYAKLLSEADDLRRLVAGKEQEPR